jgi:hypothetical protein
MVVISGVKISRDGRYFSQNPDGSKEHINPILKQASYTPPGSDSPIDCTDEVDWEGLNEIPDLCIARAVVTHKQMEEFMQKMKSQESRFEWRITSVIADMVWCRENYRQRYRGKKEEVCTTAERKGISRYH